MAGYYGKIYVGCKAGNPRQVFRSKETPTAGSHGHLFAAAIGPFRTMEAAEFMRDYGEGNPNCRCVSEAESIVRERRKQRKARDAEIARELDERDRAAGITREPVTIESLKAQYAELRAMQGGRTDAIAARLADLG